jgi:guanyl-specific ribonuclease Sa
MASIPWLADVLRAAGVQVVEEGNWRARGVPGSFNPIGVLWHHTAATSSPTNPHPALSIVINGRQDLQGPLAQALVDYNGVFHLVSANRCNHAGPIPAGDGNTMLIGWEIDYNGVSQHMTPAQYDASLKATAAVLRQLGRDANHARGHRETSTTGKIDPSFIDLNVMRSEVAALMAGGGGVAGQAYRYLDQQHVTAVGTGGTLANLMWSPGTGNLVQDWGGSGLVGKPIGYVHNGQQHVFARTATTNALRHWWQAGSGAPVMDDWGTQGRVLSNPTGFAYGRQQHVFYRNPQHELEHKFWEQSTDEITTGVWAGGMFAGNPHAFVHRDQQHIFGRGLDGALHHWSWIPGGSPAHDNWGITSGVASDPTGFSTGTQQHVFFRNTEGQLQHRFLDDASGRLIGDVWPGGPFVGNPHAITHKNQQHVFARKENGDLVHFYWSPTIDPPEHDNWGALGVVTGDPIGLSTANSHHVFYRIADGTLEHRFFIDAEARLVTDNWSGALAPPDPS